MSIVEFLLARIAEDEAVARAAIGTAAFSEQTGRWKAVEVPDDYGARPYVMAVSASGACTQVANMEAAWERDERTAHIARHDPARVLAECEAKTRIVDGWSEAKEYAEDGDLSGKIAETAYYDALRSLALPHADHPDYRPEWRP